MQKWLESWGLADGVIPRKDAVLIGRVADPDTGFPCVVAVRGNRLADITSHVGTCSDLLESDDRVSIAMEATPDREWEFSSVLQASLEQDTTEARLLSPIDLQVIKAAGVTFASSMIERVIEEKAQGDPAGARAIRARVGAILGTALNRVAPGSPEATEVKKLLTEEGLWSQYLEVGIGPDPEIFTKAPVLSSVGIGAQVGVRSSSTWSNPEPEVVLVVTSTGQVVGATLGNDVNLRDFEGRSALLLGEAKDNNASCAIGPMIRLFDDGFGLPHVSAIDVKLSIAGADGFALEEISSMRQISRRLDNLVGHAFGRHHQYPDGFVLFTGTMFAPTKDRDDIGLGFTHHKDDVVAVSTPELGVLVNSVTTSEEAPPWEFGIRELFQSLVVRGYLDSSS